MAAEKIKVIFLEGEKEIEVEALVGLSILEVAHTNEIDLEGACEGSLACATCHVVLEDKIYNTLEEPEEAEEDMLDLAFGLTHTSRLGCQIILTKELDGMRIKLPSATRNINL
jgi:ferredoxin